MKRKISLLICACAYLFAFPAPGYACSCGPYIQAFCPATSAEWDYVVLAEITENISPDKRMIRIIENIEKEIAFPEVILVGQDGLNCGEDLGKFTLGDTLVFALGKMTDSTYILSGCGRSYLYYSAGTVSGPLYTEADTSLQYADFLEGITPCVTVVSIGAIAQTDPAAKVFPNPFRNDLLVRLEGQEITNIAIYTITGQLLISRPVTGSREVQLDMQGLAPGIYISRIAYKGGVVSRKINKMR